MKNTRNAISISIVSFIFGILVTIIMILACCGIRTDSVGRNYTGVIRTYYKYSINVYTECNYVNGLKEGPEIAWYPNGGSIKAIQFYCNGKLNGPCLKYEQKAEYPFVNGEFRSGFPWSGTFLIRTDGTPEVAMNFISPSSIVARDCDFIIYEFTNGVKTAQRRILGL